MIPKLPHDATNKEIVDHIRHHYPDLGPALRQMFERLQDAPDEKDNEKLEEANESLQEQNVSIRNQKLDEIWSEFKPRCPHCGSAVPFPDEAKD